MKLIITILLTLVLTALSSPVYGEDTEWYLRVDTDDSNWAALKTTLEARQEATEAGSTLSTTPNQAGTQAIVKIIGAGQAWRDANGIDITHSAIFEIHDTNHFALLLLYNNSDWIEPEP